ncbi:hypothetical protein KKZ45_10370 [Enterobacter bugandensis]|nr:hypothetical protein [Enterobacter cloacae]MBT2090649.1 hypothetical protein [Enterobacter bugandensis]RTQ02436.1 hypothetical protein EKN38_07790 [Enterobacter sp. WCHEn045836]
MLRSRKKLAPRKVCFSCSVVLYERAINAFIKE